MNKPRGWTLAYFVSGLFWIALCWLASILIELWRRSTPALIIVASAILGYAVGAILMLK